jgi:hypothetical protein
MKLGPLFMFLVLGLTVPPNYREECAFLQSAGLESMIDLFHGEEIEMSMMDKLTDEELKQLGFNSIGSRHKFRTALKRWHQADEGVEDGAGGGEGGRAGGGAGGAVCCLLSLVCCLWFWFGLVWFVDYDLLFCWVWSVVLLITNISAEEPSVSRPRLTSHDTPAGGRILDLPRSRMQGVVTRLQGTGQLPGRELSLQLTDLVWLGLFFNIFVTNQFIINQ